MTRISHLILNLGCDFIRKFEHDFKANIEGLPELPAGTQTDNSPWQIASNGPWNPYF